MSTHIKRGLRTNIGHKITEKSGCRSDAVTSIFTKISNSNSVGNVASKAL